MGHNRIMNLDASIHIKSRLYINFIIKVKWKVTHATNS